MCYKPIYLKSQDQTVSCGRCEACHNKYCSQWAIRLNYEIKRHTFATWVTLTYNTNHVPITPAGTLTLRQSDLQKFFKRLRKRSKTKVKYLACGEYGGKLGRPHYHAIIFGSSYKDIEEAWKLNGETIGQIQFGDINSATISYTLKYQLKKRYAKDQKRINQPVFICMSKGLGDNAYVQHGTTPDGRKIKCLKGYPNEIMYLDGYKKRTPQYYNRLFQKQSDTEIFKQHQEQQIEAIIDYMRHNDLNSDKFLRMRADNYHRYVNAQSLKDAF